jgi:hypothetical protein
MEAADRQFYKDEKELDERLAAFIAKNRGAFVPK